MLNMRNNAISFIGFIESFFYYGQVRTPIVTLFEGPAVHALESEIVATS
jgi:hypothetical protein